ncbi:histidine phosphatase family protein [Alsobacter sp. R-9]
MARVFYVSHPQVKIDPAVPVPKWSLSDAGRARLVAVADRAWVRGLAAVVSSDETKAIETAELLATSSRAPVSVRDGLHENDRSATGFLPPPEFERMADAFFARPLESVRGWERAADAQARVLRGVREALAEAPAGDVAFSGHGGVGTLLYCALAGLPIQRIHDQPPGGGNVIAFDRESLAVLHPWRALEDARIGEP